MSNESQWIYFNWPYVSVINISSHTSLASLVSVCQPKVSGKWLEFSLHIQSLTDSPASRDPIVLYFFGTGTAFYKHDQSMSACTIDVSNRSNRDRRHIISLLTQSWGCCGSEPTATTSRNSHSSPRALPSKYVDTLYIEVTPSLVLFNRMNEFWRFYVCAIN